jgi:hypothetical protein
MNDVPGTPQITEMHHSALVEMLHFPMIDPSLADRCRQATCPVTR